MGTRGIAASNRRELLGQTVGRLTVVHYIETVGKIAYWGAVCRCGNIRKVTAGLLWRSKEPSCGCYFRQRASETHKGKKSNRALPLGEASFNYSYRSYEANAAGRGLVWQISRERFREITSQDCHYCGAKPANRAKQRSRAGSVNGEFVYNGIDRVDNDVGYTYANTVPCCKKCNVSKNNRNLVEYVDWIRRSYERLFCGQT